MKVGIALLGAVILASAAQAQPAGMDVFTEAKNGDKVHTASGFVCPRAIGTFVRDAAGEADPEMQTASCSYSTLDGVYGSVTLVPLRDGYQPKSSLAPQFEQQEATGGKMVWQGTVNIGKPPLAVYIRLYQTAKLEELKYTVLYSGSVVKNWAVETTIEYADPRDAAEKNMFLNGVYEAALAEIGK
ncbi:MAG TPA: hypothetical protein VG891_00785 [Rhizomicrobium sp.]|nr:hypothetical protein [Rhizomicrobium sp.]